MSLTWNDTTKDIYWGDETIAGDHLFHVDANNGNDTTGDGSIGSPWATIKKAADAICADVSVGNTDETLILVHEGNYYSWNDQYVVGAEMAITDESVATGSTVSKKMIWVGFPLKTKCFITGDSTARDAYVARFSRSGSKSFGFTFDYDYGARGGSYSRAMFSCQYGNNPDREFNNCHFILQGTPALSYSQAGAISNWHTRLSNCSMEVQPGGFVNGYRGLVGGENVCFTNVIPTNAQSWREVTNGTPSILVPGYDDNYKPTGGLWEGTGEGTNPDGSTANYGVYGGTYSWDAVVQKFNGQGHGRFINDRVPSDFDTTGFIYLNTENIDVNGRVDRLYGTTPVEKWMRADGNEIIYKDA